MNYRWHVFLSYASEDRESVAWPLFQNLTQRGLKVWIDEHELQVGDNLRERVEHGLSRSRFGVVILSQNFFKKNWTKRELDALFSLERKTKKKLLPVWHGVDQEKIAKYSSILSNRVGVETHTGSPNVCERLIAAIEREHRQVAATLRAAAKARAARDSATDGKPDTPELTHITTTSAAQLFPGVSQLVSVAPSSLPCYGIPRTCETTAKHLADGLAALTFFVDSVLRKYRPRTFLIVGVNRGGSTLGFFLADRLELNRQHIHTFDYLANWHIPLARTQPPFANVDLLIVVDDIARTGRTMRVVRKVLCERHPGALLCSTSLNIRRETLQDPKVAEDEDSVTVDYSPLVGYVSHDAIPWNTGASRDVFAYFSEDEIRKAEQRFR